MSRASAAAPAGGRRRIGRPRQVVRRVTIEHPRGERARRGVVRVEPHQRMVAPGAAECVDALLRDQPAVLRDREVLVAGHSCIAGSSGGPSSTRAGTRSGWRCAKASATRAPWE